MLITVHRAAVLHAMLTGEYSLYIETGSILKSLLFSELEEL